MAMPHGTLDDRVQYRRACQHAAERGGHALGRFVLTDNADLFAEPEIARLRNVVRVYGWDNLAKFVKWKFDSMRGRVVPLVVSRGEYPTIVETIITPHAMIRHNL